MTGIKAIAPMSGDPKTLSEPVITSPLLEGSTGSYECGREQGSGSEPSRCPGTARRAQSFLPLLCTYCLCKRTPITMVIYESLLTSIATHLLLTVIGQELRD